jgi:hypothetical protein
LLQPVADNLNPYFFMHKNQNPFAKEDLFVEIVKLDDNVNKSMRESLQNYIFKNHIPSSTLMTQFQKVLTFFTTHTLTAVVTATICLGTIGTFAAQTVAPEQYKPSTVINNLFKNNKIQQSNFGQPLISDNNSDVVGLEACNVSVKYPKQVSGEKLIPVQSKDFVEKYGADFNPEFVSIYFKRMFEQTEYDPNMPAMEGAGVTCSTDPNRVLVGTYDTPISKEKLAELTGWFITGQDIKNIMLQNPAMGLRSGVKFEFQNKYYWIEFLSNDVMKMANPEQVSPETILLKNQIQKSPYILYGNQIQIQFNDVAENIPNAEILKFDNVPTGGFKFEYDKTLALNNITIYETALEFKDPGSEKYYKVTDQALLDKISKLGLNKGDYVKFTGQVKNSDSTINNTKREEYTITKIDKIELKQGQEKSSKIPESFTSSNKPVKIIKEIDIRLAGNGLYTTYEDINSGEQYIIKDENSEVSIIIGNVVQANPPKQEPGIRKSGNENIFTFAGEVLDLGNNQYEIIKVNTFILSPNNTKDGNISIRTDGPSTSEKNGLQVFGDLFVPKSQSVRATESFDEYSPLECDIVPLKMYANNSNGQLYVSNEKGYMANGMGSTNSTPQRLNQLKEFIKTGNGEITNAINAFHSYCGGYASQYIKELGYTNKNGRQARAVLIATGQEAITDAYVYIFIQQGDKFAMMSTMSYSIVFEKCKDYGYSSINPNIIKYEECIQDLMKNNPEVEKFAKEKMQELLTSFDIE